MTWTSATRCEAFLKIFTKDRKRGSLSVSKYLHTYPSPNPTTVNWWQVRVNVGLGEGCVRSCSDRTIDPRYTTMHLINLCLLVRFVLIFCPATLKNSVSRISREGGTQPEVFLANMIKAYEELLLHWTSPSQSCWWTLCQLDRAHQWTNHRTSWEHTWNETSRDCEPLEKKSNEKTNVYRRDSLMDLNMFDRR